ncbi:MAG: fructose bisphosphate aldolase [Halanaerobiales bacterium]|nr:fructose bisphosphate aldolase [Halanaerobiales bacterium]
MNKEQAEIMRNGNGFIAALDQSDRSTPKALKKYGITENDYDSKEEMMDLVHAMRTRIITSPAFDSDRILAALLFKHTVKNEIKGKLTGDYLWEERGVVPFLKVDKGMKDEEDGVKLMKPITDLDKKFELAHETNMFGTKMRSVVKNANPDGIKKLIEQQFEFAKRIIDADLVPIVEPEIDIYSEDKGKSEELMKKEILKQLNNLSEDQEVILKLSLPNEDGFYSDFIEHPNVMRVAALSGGYSREEAVDLLSRNPGMIASYSRALHEGLKADQTDEEFNKTIANSIEAIYEASMT